MTADAAGAAHLSATTDLRAPAPEVPEAVRSLAARCVPRVNELARLMSQDTFAQLHGYAACRHSPRC